MALSDLVETSGGTSQRLCWGQLFIDVMTMMGGDGSK